MPGGFHRLWLPCAVFAQTLPAGQPRMPASTVASQRATRRANSGRNPGREPRGANPVGTACQLRDLCRRDPCGRGRDRVQFRTVGLSDEPRLPHHRRGGVLLPRPPVRSGRRRVARARMPRPPSSSARASGAACERLAEIAYHQGKPVVRQLVPPNTDEREPVPDSLQANTIDTLSALAQLIHVVAETGRCDTTVRTYDGRRAVEIEAHTVGVETAGNLQPVQFRRQDATLRLFGPDALGLQIRRRPGARQQADARFGLAGAGGCRRIAVAGAHGVRDTMVRRCHHVPDRDRSRSGPQVIRGKSVDAPKMTCFMSWLRPRASGPAVRATCRGRCGNRWPGQQAGP